jgi:hypothetical protein
MTMKGDRLMGLADVIPGLEEGSGPGGALLGIQRMVSVPIGAPLLIDGATYKHALFVAPCDGCYVKEIWVSAAVAIGAGTNTLAFDNYDASGNAARNVLEATNWDPTGVTALEGSEMTLQSTTPTNLDMDEGDVLNCTLVCGTMTTDGEGYVVTAIVVVPEVA